MTEEIKTLVEQEAEIRKILELQIGIGYDEDDNTEPGLIGLGAAAKAIATFYEQTVLPKILEEKGLFEGYNKGMAEYFRKQAITVLELTKGFIPEQRDRMGNLLTTMEELAGYIMEITPYKSTTQTEGK